MAGALEHQVALLHFKGCCYHPWRKAVCEQGSFSKERELISSALRSPTGCKQSHELDAWLRTRPGWRERGCGRARGLERRARGRKRPRDGPAPAPRGPPRPLTCTEADATCPAWSKSREMIWEKRVALPFMLVLLLPKASRTV